MAYSLSKMWTAMAVSLLAATTVQAGYNGGGDGCSPCPPVRPCVDSCGDWAVRADVLYWTSSVDNGLPYGVVVHAPPVSIPTNGRAESEIEIGKLNFEWNVGFRLGLGYGFPCDCDGWDAEVIWTHLRTHAHNSFHDRDTSERVRFIPIWGSSDEKANDDIADAAARWHLHYDIVDLELGREFCVSSCLNFRPFIGVRAGWFNQQYEIGYTDFSGNNEQDIDISSDFSGIGLRVGLGTEWKFGCGFSLFGSAAASILYGRDDIKFENDYVDGGASRILFSKNRFYVNRAIADAVAGLRWRDFYCCNTVGVVLELGWEQTYLWNQSGFNNFGFVDTAGTVGLNEDTRLPFFNRFDLSLAGITFSAKVIF